MTRMLAALALACALISPAVAARRPRGHCVPVFVEGVGTVRVCGMRHHARRAMNGLATLFASILACLRDVGGRSRRMEMELLRQSQQLVRMEQRMADTDTDLVTLIKQVRQQATDYTTTIGQRVAEAAAKAAAAQKLEDQAAAKAEHDAAVAELIEMSKELVAFSPSGN